MSNLKIYPSRFDDVYLLLQISVVTEWYFVSYNSMLLPYLVYFFKSGFKVFHSYVKKQTSHEMVINLILNLIFKEYEQKPINMLPHD